MRNIKKDFFGNQVLTDINLTLAEGEVLGLCGENGAGKSTLMKILFGMDVIRETGGYEGEILLNGKPVRFATPFDALAAGMFRLSRTEAARQIEAGNLSLNYAECLKCDAPVSAGDILSLRGAGKGRVSEIGGSSRKGRLFVTAEVYK